MTVCSTTDSDRGRPDRLVEGPFLLARRAASSAGDCPPQDGRVSEDLTEALLEWRMAVRMGAGSVDDVATAVGYPPRTDSGSSAPPLSSPKVMVPSESGLTRRPERPSVM